MKIFIAVLAFALQALAVEPTTVAQTPTAPNEAVKEKIEDIQGTIAKPTTEQTHAVSEAVLRAKKLKKKK